MIAVDRKYLKFLKRKICQNKNILKKLFLPLSILSVTISKIKIIFILISSVSLFFGSISYSANNNQMAPTNSSSVFTKRFVEIEWDEIPYAIKYELEIYNYKTKKFIKLFSSETHMFKLNVKMGKYLIRSRFTDKFERISPWSDLTELVIAPPPTQISSLPPPQDKPIFANKKTGIANVKLEWKPLPQIEKYKIIAENPEGQLIQEFESTKNVIEMPLVPNSYQFKVLAVLGDGTLGEPSAPSGIYNVAGAKILPPRLKYKRSEDGKSFLSMKSELKNGLFNGTLEYQYFESEDWKFISEIKDQKSGEFELGSNYKPGKYKATFYSVAKGFSNSDPISYEFIIKPTEPDLESIDQEVIQLLKNQPPDQKLKN